LIEIKAEIGNLERQISEKGVLIDRQDKVNTDLQQQANDLDTQIGQRDKLIGTREKKIYGLKKKTQELEKFKFVLDYKIKDLNRAIAPKEQQILELRSQTNALDDDLKYFNKTNAQSGF